MNELYKSKLVTAKEAAEVVKSGNWVDYDRNNTCGFRQRTCQTSAGASRCELPWRYPDVGTGDFQN